MKIINPTIHSILDYVVVLFLGFAPLLFGFGTTMKMFTFVLAGVHLLLTILTDFPGGIVRVIPLKLHGWVELIVSVVLMTFAFTFHFDSVTESYFYAGFGAAVLITWILTDYHGVKSTVRA